MTDDVDPVTKVARDLSEILALSAALLTQAVHKATDRAIPGGEAMYALGPVASIEAWENLNATAERTGVALTHPEDEDPDDLWPPLQTLLFWTEDWRREHGYELDRRPTIETEVGFVRNLLNWVWENEPHFEDFAGDVNRVRQRLENVLYAGRRAERTRVNCTHEPCETKPRLILIRARKHVIDLADLEAVTEDFWKCPRCKTRYDRDAFERAYARQLRSEGAERFVPTKDAVDTLRALGRSPETVRKWLAPNDAERVVEGYCEVRTHRTWVWWPDLWRLHLSTATRRRERRVA